MRVRHDDSTSNLFGHVKRCEGKDASPQTKINDFAHGSTYDKGTFRYLLVSWVARRHRPFAIIEDEELQKLFRMLYSRVEIPSASTLSRDVKETFVLAKRHVSEVLKVSSVSPCIVQ